MNNLLVHLYHQSRDKYVKYAKRLRKKLGHKPESFHSQRQLRRKYQRIKKFYSQSSHLAFQLKVGTAAALALTALSSTEQHVQAQGLGPFTLATKRIDNPLYKPIDVDPSDLPYPTFADFDLDGDVDMMLSYRTSPNYFELLPYNNYYDTKGWNMLDAGGTPPFGGFASFTRVMMTFVDIDGDGDLDGFSPYQPSAIAGVTTRWMRNDAGTFVAIPGVNPLNPFFGQSVGNRSISFVDLDGDGDYDAMAGGSFFRNTGNALNPVFEYEYGHPLQIFANTEHVAWLDIDGDGDMDALAADDNGEMHFWRNDNTSPVPFQTQNFIQDDANPLFASMSISNSGYEVIPTVVDFDGDGDDDVFITEVGSSYVETTFNYFVNDGGVWNERRNMENPLGGIGNGIFRSAPAMADIDNDGDLDAFIGTKFQGMRFYENLRESYPADRFVLQTGAGNPLDVPNNFLVPEMSDLDDDGDLDAFVGSQFALQYYRNDGNVASPSFTNVPSSLITANSPTNFDDDLNVGLGDMDEDGDLDAIIGGGYTAGTSPYIFWNTGTVSAPNFVLGPQLTYGLEYRRLELADIDHDGDADLIAGSPEYSAEVLRFFENFGGGSFSESITDNPFTDASHEQSAPNLIDWDGDGDLDLFMGTKYGSIEFSLNENLAPNVTVSGGVVGYVEGNAPVVLDNTLTIDDPDVMDNIYMSQATVVIQNYVNGQDVLSFTDHPSINEVWDVATGTLTLTGKAFAIDYRTVLRSVTYVNTSESPSTTPRTISIDLWDSDFTDPNTVTKTVTVLGINDLPQGTIGTPGVTWTEGGGAILVDPAFGVSDNDNVTLAGATITINTNFTSSEDQLLFTDQNGITGTYVSASGVLTLSGTTSLVNYQTAIRSIQYNNTNNGPNTAARTIDIVLNDGIATGNTATQTVSIVDTNDLPVVAGGPVNIPYTFGSGVINITPPDYAITDNDNANLSAGQFTISSNYVNGIDVLSFSDLGTVGGSFTPASGILSLTGTWPIAEYENTMNTVTYNYNSVSYSYRDRDIDVVVRDGSGGVSSNQSFVIELPPIQGMTVADQSFIEDAGVVQVDPAYSLIDDQPTIDRAQITITNVVASEDVLNFTNQNGITGSYVAGTGQLNLSGTATILNYRNAIRSITYDNTSETPDETTRTISVVTTKYGSTFASPLVSRDLTVTSINDQVSITPGAPLTATEGALYSYSATAVDPDDPNDGINLTWGVSGPVGMAVSATGTVTWTPPNGTTTSGPVTLSVQDGGEDGTVVATEVFTIAVTPVNTGPAITSSAGTTATEDIPYSYTPTVIDPDDPNDGVNLTWGISGAPPGMTQSATGVISWTPIEGQTTSGPVTITVQDGGEDGALPDSEIFTISVTQVNDQPSITSVAVGLATEDVAYNYTPTVNDPDDANDGVNLSWSISGEPPGMTMSATGVVDWTPVEGQTTSGPVTITVQDGGENGTTPASEVFTINVTPVNDPPLINSVAVGIGLEDTPYSYVAGATDPDDANDGTNLAWSLTNEPAGMVVSSTGTVSWTPGEGELTSGSVTLTVQDGGEDGATPSNQVFTVTVTPVNDSPNITSTAPVVATEDIAYSYSPTVVDPDDANDGTNLTWSISGEPAGMTIGATGAVSWTPLEGVTTSGAVTIAVQDGLEDGSTPSSEVFTIAVSAINDAPAITSTAGTGATEAIPYTYTPTVVDPDDANDGTNLLWSISGEPIGMTISSTGVVNWTPPNGVTTSGLVSITVQDGGEDGASPFTENFTISVTAVNVGPMITSSAGTSASEDIPYNYTPTVVDPDDANDGTNLTWSISGAPAGMTQSSTGVINWTPVEGQTTSGLVSITVQDGGEDGAIPDSENFTIAVTSINDQPSISSSAPLTATEEIPYSYSPTVIDPDDANDGTNLTWSISGQPAGMTMSATGVVSWTPAEGVLTSGTVTLQVQDGGENGTIPVTEVFNIVVTPVNDPPSITSTAGTSAVETLPYTYTATVLDPDDANDGINLAWSLSGQPAGMTVSATGQVSWTPPLATSSSGPVTLTVQDGGEDGTSPASEIFTIAVAPNNEPPVLTLTGTEVTYTENGSALSIDNGVGLTDDATTIFSATITISNYQAAEDIFTFSAAAGITANIDAVSGTITFTGPAPISQYRSAFRSIQYSNTSEAPSTLDRVLMYTAFDGLATSNIEVKTLKVMSVNDIPLVSGTTITESFPSGSPPISIFPIITVSDTDSNITGATVSITSGLSPEDILSFTPFPGISGSYDPATGVLTFTGSATDADYQTLLRSLTFENTGSEINPSARSISVVVTDGTDSSSPTSLSVNVESTDGIPLLQVLSSRTYTENDGPMVIDPNVVITDDSPDLSSASVTISSNYVESEDQLIYTTQNGISGSFDASTGVLSLAGTSLLANYQSAVASIEYENTSDNPSFLPRTISFVVNDGINDSNIEDLTLDVQPVNDLPVLVGALSDLFIQSQTGPTLANEEILITDLDDLQLFGAEVTIGGNYEAGRDLLAFADQNGISGTFSTATGLLALTGTASVADYTTALASVTFENTGTSDPSNKSISFIVFDGDGASNTLTRIIRVNPTFVSTTNLSANADIGFTTSVDVLDGASTNPGDILTLTLLSTPTLGNAVIENTTILYTPNADSQGSDIVEFELCNQWGSCSVAQVQFNIQNATPEIQSEALETAQGEIANIDLLSLINDPNDNLDLSTLTIIAQPISNAFAFIDSAGVLTIDYAANPFAGVDRLEVEVCDLAGICATQELTIVVGELEGVNVFNAVSPNGDGLHDFLNIEDIEFFASNKVYIYDKVGQLVYDASNYNNDDIRFEGISRNGNELANGTYYYVVELTSTVGTQKRQSGYFVLNR